MGVQDLTNHVKNGDNRLDTTFSYHPNYF